MFHCRALIRESSEDDLRVSPLGPDSKGTVYFHFPQFVRDTRLYTAVPIKHKPPTKQQRAKMAAAKAKAALRPFVRMRRRQRKRFQRLMGSQWPFRMNIAADTARDFDEICQRLLASKQRKDKKICKQLQVRTDWPGAPSCRPYQSKTHCYIPPISLQHKEQLSMGRCVVVSVCRRRLWLKRCKRCVWP